VKKLFALAAAALLMSSSSAMAAGATITYYVKNVGVPSYGTASIIESFTGTAGTSAFPTGTTKTQSISTTAYTGTLTETVTASQVNKTNGSTYAAFVNGATGTSGTGPGHQGWQRYSGFRR